MRRSWLDILPKTSDVVTMSTEPDDLETSQIKNWRSIVTLIVFVFTNIIVLFPFHIPVFIPRLLSNAILDSLSALRITSPRRTRCNCTNHDQVGKFRHAFVRLNLPMNFVTAPLIADLFLLAILAIGRKEVHDGTLGANIISPIDIIAFFVILAYITFSIDASGLIRYLAFKVLQKGGNVGHRLFFYLYAFFFSLGTFIGNDPIILSGTAFLAYMTRVSSNIIHPRAWIHTQFAVANIASAIFVSSNPTNLVLAGALQIKFVEYTVNMIVPVVVTAIVLFPFLLYFVFADESLIPVSIEMHKLSEEAMKKTPVNPNIPHARGLMEEQENQLANDERSIVLPLDENMNPFLDKGGAAFGAVIMAATLVTLLALNAASQSTSEHPVYWVTLPAAFVMFCWDIAFGWYRRKETRGIARKGLEGIELARAERAIREEEDARRTAPEQERRDTGALLSPNPAVVVSENVDDLILSSSPPSGEMENEKQEVDEENREVDEEKQEKERRERLSREMALRPGRQTTLVSLLIEFYSWCQETFPTLTAGVTHLPFALVPFAFSMFVLVQALVTKGWVLVFAYGWDHWVNKTGTVGAVYGMGFLSVILCNFAGTNIGTTILLSRVIQAWQTIHQRNGIPISNRTFWGTVYSMALGVNYGAFSVTFSASLAGLLWRDILARKHILVRRAEFARVNLPIIMIAIMVGCAVLVGEVYIVRDNNPYDS